MAAAVGMNLPRVVNVAAPLSLPLLKEKLRRVYGLFFRKCVILQNTLFTEV